MWCIRCTVWCIRCTVWCVWGCVVHSGYRLVHSGYTVWCIREASQLKLQNFQSSGESCTLTMGWLSHLHAFLHEGLLKQMARGRESWNSQTNGKRKGVTEFPRSPRNRGVLRKVVWKSVWKSLWKSMWKSIEKELPCYSLQLHSCNACLFRAILHEDTLVYIYISTFCFTDKLFCVAM